MNTRRFNHLLAVVDAGSFGRAAAGLQMRQPPLSQSIARLERDLGVRLLKRSRSGATPTLAGEAFIPEARAAVAASARAVALARSATVSRATVRVGVVSPALWEVVPAVLRAAREARVSVDLQQIPTNEQLKALTRGELELGLVTPPFDGPARMRVTSLANERVVLAIPSGSLPRGKDKNELKHFAHRLILFPRVDGPVLYDAIIAMFTAKGLQPVVVQDSARMLSTLALVAAGVGVALVPSAMARKLAIDGVVFRELVNVRNVPTWPIAIAHMPLNARSAAARLLACWRAAQSNRGEAAS
jgi:DNA-binding transcriptional LysR family regulator